MIYLKTDDENRVVAKANLLVSATLTEIAKIVELGVTQCESDTLAEQFIRDHGATPHSRDFLILTGGHSLLPFARALTIQLCMVFPK